MQIHAQSISDELKSMAGRYGFDNPAPVVIPEFEEGFYHISMSVEDPYDKNKRLCVKGTAKITSPVTIERIAKELMNGIKNKIEYLQ